MNKKHSGFALIEIIVAIVILSSVLAGATTLIWSAATAVTKNQDRLTATYLAQECLELARNARDSSWKQHLPWDCVFAGNTSQCADIAEPIQTMINDENLIEILEKQTRFSRTMILPENWTDSLEISCKVEWPLRSGTETLILSEVLTNWKQI